MELITILNRCHFFPGLRLPARPFQCRQESIEVAVRPRKGSTAVCSRCHLPAPGSFVPPGTRLIVRFNRVVPIVESRWASGQTLFSNHPRAIPSDDISTLPGPKIRLGTTPPLEPDPQTLTSQTNPILRPFFALAHRPHNRPRPPCKPPQPAPPPSQTRLPKRTQMGR